MPPLAVGQTLHFVPAHRHNGNSHDVVVMKIGRKWADIRPADWQHKSHRIALDDWRADGGGYSSPGRCYASKEVYDAETARREAWQGLQRQMRDACGQPPDGVTVDAMRQARLLLGLEWGEG